MELSALKIGGQRPVGAGSRVGGVGAARGAARTESVAAPGAVQDTTSVLGIPDTEFTPKVRTAIMMLLQEVDSLRHDLEQSKKRIQHLEKLADQDTLTLVANRRAFVRELSRMLSFAQRYGSRVSVLYFDIDDMKHINDTYGHPAGDAAISHVASMLIESVRESDIVGRLGGDEFGVILANADEDAARVKAEQLAHEISSRPIDCKGKKISVAITFGAYALQDDDDAHAMLEQADRAMYAAKPREGQSSS
jgi:diguanylate cyclase (GGDEF)-like protein